MTDNAIRLEAIDPLRSILLQAPAGSGKTTVLSQRFLALLATVSEPEEILAITFTRKAAAEMRERVLRALDGQLDGDDPMGRQWAQLRGAVLARSRAQGWSTEDLPGRLRIQTIDSFNHELARAMPVLGRFQSSLQVVDDAGPLFHEAARRTLQALDAEPELAADADLLLQRLDNNSRRAEELLATLLASRERWMPTLVQHGPADIATAVESSLRRIVTGALQALDGLPADWLAEGAALARASSQHRERLGKPPGPWRHWLDPQARLATSLDQLPAWRTLADLALTQEGGVRKTITVTHGFPKEEKALKLRHANWAGQLLALPLGVQFLHDLATMPDPWLPTDERAAFAALGRILVRAVTELNLVFNEHGRVDHPQVAVTARQALVEEGAPTELAIRHMLRIRHLLVDEFQDVSPEQVRLLETLTTDWSPGDGRSLFLVGDPMQSIYLFRNSEVGLFLRVRERGIGSLQLEPLQLSRNFRSQARLVEWVNAAFPGIFPSAEDARRSAVAFLPSVAARPAEGATGVEIWPFDATTADQEAGRIADEIARLRGASTKKLRIAILVRDRSLAPPILAALHARAIPVLGADLAPLAAHASVQDLVALGSALLHAGDRTAWLAVLRAPFCGLQLADLALLCAGDPDALLVERIEDPQVLQALSPDARQRLERCAPALRDAWRRRGSDGLDVAIRRLWQRLGGPDCCQDATEREAAAQFLIALHTLLEGQPRTDGQALAALAVRLRDARPPGSEGQGDLVEMMTIHHAKGLEWDIVFLPGLGKRARSDDAPLMRWLELPGEEGEDLLMSVHSLGSDSARDPLSLFIRLLQKQRRRNEQARLAYVAATRARERLYISGVAGPDGPPASSLLGTFWPAVATHFAGSPDPQVPTPVAAPVRAQAPAWRRVAADFDPAAGLPELPRPPGTVAQTEGGVTALEFQWVGPAARAAGTVVHEELEHLARSGELSKADFGSRHPLWQRRLLELGMPAQEVPGAVAGIAVRLEGLRADPIARWLLETPHADAQCELRLSGSLDGRLQNAVIDRSFIDEKGDRWVIDYKTGTHGGGGLEAFIAEEIERYRPQLERYRQLAGRLGPQPVRAALYFPWLGVLRELPP